MKKRPIILVAVILFSVGIIFQSCKKDETNLSKEVTYSKDVASLMNNYCLTCHSGADPTAGLSLDSYTNVKAVAESGQLVDRINDTNNPMPPSGIMSENNRNIIINWIAGGYQP